MARGHLQSTTKEGVHLLTVLQRCLGESKAFGGKAYLRKWLRSQLRGTRGKSVKYVSVLSTRSFSGAQPGHAGANPSFIHVSGIADPPATRINRAGQQIFTTIPRTISRFLCPSL
jgi:hypothetical protein